MPPSVGFTLVELLVCIAIIGVIIGLMIPGVQSMRESTRRANCAFQLRVISLGLSAYHDRFQVFPMGSHAEGVPIRASDRDWHHSWIARLLPDLDLQVVADRIDFGVSVYSDENREVREYAIPQLRCPAASGLAANTTSYAGIHSSAEVPLSGSGDGVFLVNRTIGRDDIPDGVSQTLLLGEKVSSPMDDLGWISGTRSTLRNTRWGIDSAAPQVFVSADQRAVERDIEPELYVGGLASFHPGGAHLLMGGGEVLFRTASMDQEVFRQITDRADGSLPLPVNDGSDAPPGKPVETDDRSPSP
ncbi:MAG: DUF1559 domain-containing protein [Planctomycetota bacterium]